MVLEELILHYYLKVFSLLIVTLLITFFLYTLYILNKDLDISDRLIIIKKGEKIENFLSQNINNLSKIESIILNSYFKSSNILLNKFIHFGEFNVESNVSAKNLLEIVSNPSNIINRITIVEGWTNKQLKFELSKYFKNIKNVPYENIIADTYFFEKNSNFETFVENLITIKSKYMNNFKDNIIYKKFTENEIMIIGSIIEKEGLDREDKKKISSVIFNRLKKNMKLQSDPTVVYAITQGKKKMDRKLLRKDLKIKSKFNTYVNKGLPPEPICIPGIESLVATSRPFKSNFLYFVSKNKKNEGHLFSEKYKDHLENIKSVKKRVKDE